MYNEVFDDCPHCGKHTGYLQIHQIVLGFGEFDLADLAYLKNRYDTGNLTAANIQDLAAALTESDATFYCRQSEGWNPYASSPDCANWRADPAKVLAVQMLTSVDEGDTRERALRLLHDAGII
jgi:hypothetical protein